MIREATVAWLSKFSVEAAAHESPRANAHFLRRPAVAAVPDRPRDRRSEAAGAEFDRVPNSAEYGGTKPDCSDDDRCKRSRADARVRSRGPALSVPAARCVCEIGGLIEGSRMSWLTRVVAPGRAAVVGAREELVQRRRLARLVRMHVDRDAVAPRTAAVTVPAHRG